MPKIFFFTFILLLIPASVFSIDKPFSFAMKRLDLQPQFVDWPGAKPEPDEVSKSKIQVSEKIRKVFVCIELLGNQYGVFLLIGLLALASKKCFTHFPLIFAGVLGAGIVSTILKKCIIRTRPYGFSFLDDPKQSFDGFSLLKNSEDLTQSFPSGHTTLAVALLVFLIWLFPRGRWCFYALGLWLITYRIAMGAHFFSDTLAGVLVGGVFASVCIFLYERYLGKTSEPEA